MNVSRAIPAVSHEPPQTLASAQSGALASVTTLTFDDDHLTAVAYAEPAATALLSPGPGDPVGPAPVVLPDLGDGLHPAPATRPDSDPTAPPDHSQRLRPDREAQ